MPVKLDQIPFVQAKHYKAVPTGRERRKIVIHSMEAPELTKTAENVAQYFARGPVVASAHYCIDGDSIVQCVQTRDVAYAAPGANNDGVHLELAGYARQSRQEWEDAYSLAMLRLAAELCGKVLVPKLRIPVEFINADDMKRDMHARGFTTHHEVTLAFRRSTHTDPGPGFPMVEFLAMVREAMG